LIQLISSGDVAIENKPSKPLGKWWTRV